MADYRRHHDENSHRHDRDLPDRAGDEVRSWFGDGRRGPNDATRDERGSRWEGPAEDTAFGTYRTDDRAYHDRFREQGANWVDEGRPSSNSERPLPWGPRERGGYWRQYELTRPNYAGRGPKGYQRSDDRMRDEICDCMTDDPMLDASEITVEVKQGEVTLSGSVTSREQKRRAEDVAERVSGVRDVTNQLRVTRDATGYNWNADSSGASAPAITSSQPVTQASGKGSPSKSTSSTTA